MLTTQASIGSGFGVASTAAEVIAGIDLTGTVAIVTGGYSGLGVETVRAFSSAGAPVIVPARDRTRAAPLDGITGVEIEIDGSSRHGVDRRVCGEIRRVRAAAAHSRQQRRHRGHAP